MGPARLPDFDFAGRNNIGRRGEFLLLPVLELDRRTFKPSGAFAIGVGGKEVQVPD